MPNCTYLVLSVALRRQLHKAGVVGWWWLGQHERLALLGGESSWNGVQAGDASCVWDAQKPNLGGGAAGTVQFLASLTPTSCMRAFQLTQQLLDALLLLLNDVRLLRHLRPRVSQRACLAVQQQP